MTAKKVEKEAKVEELPANGPNPVPSRSGLEPEFGEASAHVEQPTED